ncbi:MAG: gamma carbonic anhydrase family protein [Eubacteriales bacterium]|nr:gamma carbonic anhydrase family protein [Eubacteriales bacterium]
MENLRYIHPAATVMGHVTLGEYVNIWPAAVVRADMAPIQIGDWTNVQDGCVLHVDTGLPLLIGSNVTIGHRAVLHSCTIHDNCLIGMGAIILDGAEIGENCLIAAGSLVPPGKTIPPNSLVMGQPGRVVRQLTQAEIEKQKNSPRTYWQLALWAMGKEQD